MNNEQNNDYNLPEKNYYWQSFIIAFILFVVFIIVFVSLGFRSVENTGIGFTFFLLLGYFINIVLKKIAKKHGDDLLK